MDQRRDRRTILAVIGGSVASVSTAGCIGSSARNSNTTEDSREEIPTNSSDENSTGESDPVSENPPCDGDRFQRRDGWIEEDALRWGELSGGSGNPVFSLTSDSTEYERGDQVAITLANESAETRKSANVHKSNLDVATARGWRDPRGWRDGVERPITDELWEWEPGETFEWTFKFTEQGVVNAAYPQHRDHLVTCPELPAGQYRFATSAPLSGDVGVRFELVD